MSTDTDRLAREAEQHRSSVDNTLDELRSRFSVGQMVDEVSGYVREGQGADMVRNLRRQVRDNPLALGLVGAGIVWLLMGSTAREQGYRLKDRYDDWREDDDDDFDDVYSSRRYARSADYQEDLIGDYPRGGRASRYPLSDGDRVGYAGPSSGSSGPGMTDRARDAASNVGSSVSGAASAAGSSVSGAASSAGARLSEAGQAAADAARRAGSSASAMGHDAADAIRRTGHDAADAVGRAGYEAREAAYRAGDTAYRNAAFAGRRVYGAGRQVRRTFLDTLQEEPLVMGAVALAIGAAVGAALPPTRREDEWLGEARDRLRDEAYDYGRETLEKAEHVADETFKSVSDEAQKKGLLPTGEGETIAEKVSGVAKKAGETAKSEAKKEGLA